MNLHDRLSICWLLGAPVTFKDSLHYHSGIRKLCVKDAQMILAYLGRFVRWKRLVFQVYWGAKGRCSIWGMGNSPDKYHAHPECVFLFQNIYTNEV